MPSGDEADPRAPLFFLSYAHSTVGPQSRFTRFFNDLSENVAELVVRAAGADPGYIDRSMGGGNHWTRELLEAVGTCQVFVALLSAPYFKSTWCGMEWFAFTQRRVIRKAGAGIAHQTAVVPVIWAAPLPYDHIPAAVQKVQRFTPGSVPKADIAGQCEAEGIVGLLHTQIDLYNAVVWRLAQRIAEISNNYHVEPRVFRADELRNIFLEP